MRRPFISRAEATWVTPYLPADVLAALTILLPGSPIRRWRWLAVLIKQLPTSGGRAP
jgi:hypothetical protein